ncbi:hypothetical protein DWF00_27050 [Bosea caraganae]|uniref:Uncharacterized protein n=1 Tax=Bosea caraganae TaxID=2763117 RepID=A0A370L9I0_9HYPH|nr:hypothetical protein [Bosea caraganae]RDJ21981.1 hypothetical protein DWF00_27050 [Bosea caraganae]RDJ27985.1 hypothetical protein DWE98_05105 [Bosea caraganae]
MRRTANSRFTSKNYDITYDHAIPLATLWQGLRTCIVDAAEMNSFLELHVAGVVLLKAENAKLNKCGLRSSMPPGAPAYDKLARYRHADIAFEPADEARLKIHNPN